MRYRVRGHFQKEVYDGAYRQMIEKITDKKELSRLIMASMKRGVATNCFTASAFAFDIDEERLYYEKCGDSLFLLRKRDGVCILNFYVNGDINLPAFTDVCGELSVVTEIPVYDNGHMNEAEARLRDIVTGGGFECILERTMLEKAVCGTEPQICNESCHALQHLAPMCGKLIRCAEGLHSPVTGCVPTFSDFRQTPKTAVCLRSAIRRRQRCSEVLE